jgi:septum site-determining protein MinC
MPAPSAVQPSSSKRSTFEIKSAQLPLVALLVKTSDFQTLAEELNAAFGPKGETPDFFEKDGLVLDFTSLDVDVPAQGLEPLLRVLKTCNLIPVAYRCNHPAWAEAAEKLGLFKAEPEVQRSKAATVIPEPRQTLVQEVIREVPGPATMVIDKPLRSGQKVYAKGCDLVVLAMVNQGAEVVADGNIHVYAALRGKAMAGARGNAKARIFALSLEPELVSIAGVYRTSENPFPKEVHGKTAQVRLSDDGQEKLLIEALKA